MHNDAYGLDPLTRFSSILPFFDYSAYAKHSFPESPYRCMDFLMQQLRVVLLMENELGIIKVPSVRGI